jgi:hypothetical protein
MIYIGVTHAFDCPDNVGGFVEKLIADGNLVFVGIGVPERVRAELLGDVDDALAETVGRLAAELRGPRP